MDIFLNAIDQNTFENIHSNYSKDNPGNNVIYLYGELVSDSKIMGDNNFSIENLIIPINIVLEIGSGSNLKLRGSNHIINGILKINGNAGNDTTIVGSGTSNSGYFTIEEGGKVEASYTKFLDFNTSNSITNNGTLKLDNCELSIKTGDWVGQITSNKGNIEITNSKIHTRLNILDSNNIKLENNLIIDGIQVQKKPSETISIKNNVSKGGRYPLDISYEALDLNSYENITGNYNEDNQSSGVTYMFGTQITDIKLSKGMYAADNLIIPVNAVLEIESGSSLKLRGGNHVINGTLKLNGSTEDNTIVVGSGSSNSGYFTIEEGGKVEASYTKFLDFNTSNSITNNGTLKLDNCELSVITSDWVGQLTSNKGNVEITNSKLYTRLNILESNNIKLENNLIKDGISVQKKPSETISIKNNVSKGGRYPLDISFSALDLNSYQNISGNYNEDNVDNGVTYMFGVPITDVKLLNGMYAVDNLIIPSNIVLDFEAGSNIILRGGKHTIDGTLKLNGNIENNNILKGNGADREGYFKINEGGKVEASYTNVLNFNIYSNITNNGTLKLNSCEFPRINGYQLGIITSNNGNIEITNSKLYTRLNILESNNIRLENNFISNGIDVRKKNLGLITITDNVSEGQWYPLDISFNAIDNNTFQNIRGNYNKDNSQNSIVFLKDTPITNVKLFEGVYSVDNLLIPENIFMEVDAGVTIKFRSGYPTIKGVMYLNGDKEKPVTLTKAPREQSTASGNHWSRMEIENTGLLLAYNANIEYAGSSYYHAIENNGQLIIYNSSLTNCY